MANGFGQTCDGRNSKVHAICDVQGRACGLMITPGNVHDMKVARACIAAMPPSAELVGDMGYDSNGLRAWLADPGTLAVIHAKKTARSSSVDQVLTESGETLLVALEAMANSVSQIIKAEESTEVPRGMLRISVSEV